MLIRVVRGDIEKLAVDAIVNATNETMDGYGGVDGCIRRAAGVAFNTQCNLLAPITAGEAKWTPGFDLPAKYVIHTVAPSAKTYPMAWREILEMCYEASFATARKLGATSIAFPAIGTGAYRLPLIEATATAVAVVISLADSAGSVKEVSMVAHDDAMEHHLKVAILGGPPPSCASKTCPKAHQCAQFYPLSVLGEPLNEFTEEGCWLYMPAERSFE